MVVRDDDEVVSGFSVVSGCSGDSGAAVVCSVVVA